MLDSWALEIDTCSKKLGFFSFCFAIVSTLHASSPGPKYMYVKTTQLGKQSIAISATENKSCNKNKENRDTIK